MELSASTIARRARDLAPLAKGALTYVPPLLALARRRDQGGGATASAAYCYSVWLRHLSALERAGLDTNPTVVAELGPGDSIGVGLAALLCGAESYIGLDLLPFAARRSLLPLFDDLVGLVAARVPAPDGPGFERVRPRAAAFPAALTEARLAASLAPARVALLRAALTRPLGAAPGPLRYLAPWMSGDFSGVAGTVDLVLSQAVLEHVDDLPGTLRALRGVLRPGGLASHVVDFRCHGLSQAWNGHYGYGEWSWRLVRGRRAFAINRVPLCGLRALAADSGFVELACDAEQEPGGLTRAEVAPPFRALSDRELSTACAHLLWRAEG